MEFDKIAWISCDLKGTTLTVKFTETITKDITEDFDKPCNIVAVKSAVITKNIVNQGVVTARKGDEVKKGDVLITGVINVTNEYDELIETDYVSAKGFVYGIVEYNYNDSFEISCYEKRYTDKNEKQYSMFLCDRLLKIPKLKKAIWIYMILLQKTAN